MKLSGCRKKYLFIILILLIAAAATAVIAVHNNRTFQASIEETYPKVDGSFIQSWLVVNWDDAKWQKEFEYLKEAGMHYLILAPSADCESGKVTRTIYPSNIEGWQMYDGYPDLVDNCLRNAQRAGIKVFLGFNMHEDWWKKYANDPQWLYNRMSEGNDTAKELYDTYKSKYPDTLYGWYWVWEVDNLNFRKKEQQEVLAKALNINIDHLNAMEERLPLMQCPFMNHLCGKAAEYRDMWINVFSKTHFAPRAIFS
jgi:hypothetical protein